MPSGRALIEVAAHRVWKFVSWITFRFWRATGLRQRWLSSKGQDRWVISIFSGMREGFFVEVGAGNGFIGSDTYVLEADFGWHGICVEPNPHFYHELTAVVNRRCMCVQACVDRKPQLVEFAVAGDMSGIVAEDTDNTPPLRETRLRRLRRSGNIVQLRSTTLDAVLAQCGAPHVIHYMSIDVEGAEERVLSAFPFDRYDVKALTVERPTRVIHDLLSSAGFVLARYHLHDGFYVRRELWDGCERAPDFRRKAF